MNVAKRVCGISKGGHNQKTTWWWNEEVKEVIKEKRHSYKVWQKKKKPTIKRTILGYEKESQKSGSSSEGKGRQKNNRTS